MRLLVTGFLCAVLAATAALGYDAVYLKQDEWRLFDWLIQYEPEFIRRGLPGSLIFWLDETAGIDVRIGALGLMLSAYAVFILASLSVVRRIDTLWPYALLIFSPAVFLFQIADRKAGFRKEVLFLALLALLAAVFLSLRTERGQFRALVAALLVMPLLVLTHEATVFYIPYLLFFGMLLTITRARLAWTAGVLSLSGAAAIAVALHKGGPEDVPVLCAAIREALPPSRSLELCETTSAIGWIGQSVEEAVAYRERNSAGLLRDLFPVIALIGAAYPLALADLARRLAVPRREWIALGLAVGVAVLASVVVFVLAINWGRFIYVHAAASAVLVFALAARHRETGHAAGPPPAPAVPVWAMIVPYALFWNVNNLNALVDRGILMDALTVVGRLLRLG
ncbi:MAG: hypothetical protein ACFBSD_12360 [Paracoccaceae bacterium]